MEKALECVRAAHEAVMKEFAPEEKLVSLKKQLAKINRKLVRDLEFEYLIRFPHVMRRLARAGINVW